MVNLEKYNNEKRKIIEEILGNNGIEKQSFYNKNYDEYINIEFRCSKTKRNFYLLFGRKNSEKYKIIKIIKDTDDIKAISSSDIKTSSSISDFDIDNIELTNFICPYCSNNAFAKCECNKLGCQGIVEIIDKKNIYTCPWCGSKGPITGYIKKVSGTKQKKENLSNPKKQIDSKGPFKMLKD